jgi:hypothetical protein
MNQIKAYIKYHSGQKFNADPLTVFAFISFLFLSISVMDNQSSEEINIYWTDTGVYPAMTDLLDAIISWRLSICQGSALPPIT